MKRIVCLLLIAVLGAAKEYGVVANVHLPIKEITQEKLRQIFLKKHRFIGDVQLVVLNQKPNSPIRRSFEKNVLHMSRQRLKRYWTAEHYKGNRPPIPLSSDESVIKFVQKVEGAIGYVDLQKLPKGSSVRILYKWSR